MSSSKERTKKCRERQRENEEKYEVVEKGRERKKKMNEMMMMKRIF